MTEDDTVYEGTVDEIKQIMSEIDYLKKNQTNNNKITNTPILLENIKEQLPSKQQIIDYILSKPKYENDSADIQQNFLGRHIKSKSEERLYHNFAQLIRNAREDIVKNHNGEWVDVGTIPLGGRSHVKKYKFKPKGYSTQTPFGHS